MMRSRRMRRMWAFARLRERERERERESDRDRLIYLVLAGKSSGKVPHG
jgi:hypothetical protein